jgi:cytidine deaminase
MSEVHENLIKLATKLSVPNKLTDEATSGFVGAALITNQGNIYTGKSLTGSCGIQFCGEVGAVLEMLKAGESHIKRIVAVSNDHKLMPPCGRCREMMYEIDRKNLDTEIVLDDKVVTLKDLFPERWQDLWAS